MSFLPNVYISPNLSSFLFSLAQTSMCSQPKTLILVSLSQLFLYVCVCMSFSLSMLTAHSLSQLSLSLCLTLWLSLSRSFFVLVGSWNLYKYQTTLTEGKEQHSFYFIWLGGLILWGSRVRVWLLDLEFMNFVPILVFCLCCDFWFISFQYFWVCTGFRSSIKKIIWASRISKCGYWEKKK